MNRDSVKKAFENMGSRITIRTGTSTSGTNRPLTLNVSKDRKGEHFTLTLHPLLDEEKTIISVMDTDKKHRQMLLNVIYWTIPEDEPKPSKWDLKNPRRVQQWKEFHDNYKPEKPRKVVERVLVGHDEMHWFVAGVTQSTTIKEAFYMLRPGAVTLAAKRAGVKDKDVFRHKTKGFIRQGEWFFVPAYFKEDKLTIIHKNEPINRQGGSPHIVEELVRSGGDTVYVKGSAVLTEKEYLTLPVEKRRNYAQRVRGARVLGRGKVKHRDHHTILLKGWHEIHLSTERTPSSSGGSRFSGINAFID